MKHTNYSLEELEFSFQDENFLGRGRGKKLVRNIGNKVKEKIQNVAKTVKEPQWIPLTPFKPVMQKMLRKRGANSSGSLPEVARRFYNVVIQGKKNYSDEKFIDPVTIGVIVSSVLKFFKTMQDKKSAGAETDEERDVLADVELFARSALDNPEGVFSERTVKNQIAPSGRSSEPETPAAPPSGPSGAEEKSSNTGLIIAGLALFYFATKGN